jgi:hypothetical protein
MLTRNAMTVARVCRAGLAGSALVILSAALAAAEFGPRAIIGKNYQQSSNTGGVTEFACDSSSLCLLAFQPIPQQQPLLVQHVACRVNVSAGSLLTASLETWSGQTLVSRHTNLVPVATSGLWWAVNSPVIHLIKSGERPIVRFDNTAGADWFVDCNISGTLQ